MTPPRGRRKDNHTHKWITVNGKWLKCRRAKHNGMNVVLIPTGL